MSDFTGPTGTTGTFTFTNPTGPIEPPPPITIDDLLTAQEVLQQKEAADKAVLETIGNLSHEELKSKLIRWTSAGFPNAYEVHRVTLYPPPQCSDGVTRNLSDYIQFCSGKTIYEHVAMLQGKATGMVFSFANMGGYIAIVVSKLTQESAQETF